MDKDGLLFIGLSTICKSDLSDKIRRGFFQVVIKPRTTVCLHMGIFGGVTVSNLD